MQLDRMVAASGEDGLRVRRREREVGCRCEGMGRLGESKTTLILEEQRFISGREEVLGEDEAADEV